MSKSGKLLLNSILRMVILYIHMYQCVQRYLGELNIFNDRLNFYVTVNEKHYARKGVELLF